MHHGRGGFGLVLFDVLDHGHHGIDPFFDQALQGMDMGSQGFFWGNPIGLEKVQHQQQGHGLGSAHPLTEFLEFLGDRCFDAQAFKPFLFVSFIHFSVKNLPVLGGWRRFSVKNAQHLPKNHFKNLCNNLYINVLTKTANL